MNKLLELQLSVWKLTGTINRLQAVETRSTDEDTELTTATTEYADVQRPSSSRRANASGPGWRPHAWSTPRTRPSAKQRALCGTRETWARFFTAVMETAIGGRGKPGSPAGVSAVAGKPDPPRHAPTRTARGHPLGRETRQPRKRDVLAPVFASGAGAFLGVDRPTVAMGDAVYPVLTSRPTVGGPTCGLDRGGRNDRWVHSQSTRPRSNTGIVSVPPSRRAQIPGNGYELEDGAQYGSGRETGQRGDRRGRGVV